MAQAPYIVDPWINQSQWYVVLTAPLIVWVEPGVVSLKSTGKHNIPSKEPGKSINGYSVST
jgi:hypothetical protein